MIHAKYALLNLTKMEKRIFYVMAGRRPDRKLMIEQMVLVNERFMAQHPVAGDSIRINGVRPSNIWTRSVYMEGLLALNEVAPQPRYVEYAMDWAVANR